LTQSYKHIKVCHFASVHTIVDTRVFYRECVSLARHFDVTYIGIGNYTGERNGVRIIGVKNPSNRLKRLLYTTFRVCYLALKEDADIYHFHDAELIPFGIVLRVLGKKVIYDIHENTYEDIIHKPWIPQYIKFIAGKTYRFLEWMASLFMPFILVIGKREFAKRFMTHEYSIVQNYADLSELRKFRVSNRSQLEGDHLFYIGTVFDYYYNFSKLIEAIFILQQQGKIIHLHCVGYLGNLVRQGLSNDANFHAVKDQITFHGHIVHPGGFDISTRCKIGICLKNQPEEILVSHERKFFEYLAIGMPVITCNSHIYKEIIDTYQTGKYVNLEEAGHFAETIRSMFEAPEQLQAMSDNCIEAAEKVFNWESQEKLLLELYYSLLTQ
jgi:glycosyltransferase involved in cell wall biosynthesis